MLFKIGDIVKIDYHTDLVYGIVTEIHTYAFAVPVTYHYDILDFFDGNTDYHISEKWISYAEDPIAPYKIENCNQTITDK